MESTSEKKVHWDLSNVYPGLESEEFSYSVDSLSEKISDLTSYIEVQGISREGAMPEDEQQLAGRINGYLDRINAIRSLYRTLAAYLYSFTATDSFNTLAKRLFSELQIQGSTIRQQEVRFQGWIGQLDADHSVLDHVVKEDVTVMEHAFYLRELSEQSRYLMSEEEEALATQLALSGSIGWEKLQGVVTSQSKAKVDLDGRVGELPVTILQTYRNHQDGSIRRQAYEAELAAWESVREPLAACMNGVKGEVNTLNHRRGREDALASSLEMARIDRQTLEAMLSAMRESFPAFRRYWKAKARLLNQE